MDILKQLIAKRIKQHRGDMSQAAFAALLGVTRVTVSDWEREVKVPTLLTLARVARSSQRGHSLASGVLDLILDTSIEVGVGDNSSSSLS